MSVEKPEICLLEREDNDKKIELIVLMSTSHVNPLIGSCVLNILISLSQDPVQVMLTSTMSGFVLSFFSSLSCPSSTSRTLGGFFPSPCFPCQPYRANNHTTKRARQRMSYSSARQAGSNGLLRVAAAQSWSWASPRMLPENAMMLCPRLPLRLPLILRIGSNGKTRHEWTHIHDSATQRPERTAKVNG